MADADGTPSTAGRNRHRLVIVLGLTSTYMLAEIAGGLATNSLALIADAGHMFTDVFGLGLALFAIWLGGKPATPQRTYGYYRTEILAALANSMLLFAISAYILYEAWQRFQEPPEVRSGPMLAVAVGGLIINLVSAWLLRGGAEESLNVQGAFLEVVSDLLGSLGVILAGTIITLTGWYYADPIVSVVIGLFIIPRTARLLREAVGILLEGTPSHINPAEVRVALETIPNVESVHDLHIWSVTSGYVALSAHARLADGADGTTVLRDLNALLHDRFDIEHTTIQIETSGYQDTPAHL